MPLSLELAVKAGTGVEAFEPLRFFRESRVRCTMHNATNYCLHKISARYDSVSALRNPLISRVAGFWGILPCPVTKRGPQTTRIACRALPATRNGRPELSFQDSLCATR